MRLRARLRTLRRVDLLRPRMSVIRVIVEHYVQEEPGTPYYTADPNALVDLIEGMLGPIGTAGELRMRAHAPLVAADRADASCEATRPPVESGAQEAFMPKWLVKLFAGIAPEEVRPMLQAFVAGWGNKQAMKAACIGLGKLARHMATRCSQIAQDDSTAQDADAHLYAAQVLFDQAAAELRKASEQV